MGLRQRSLEYRKDMTDYDTVLRKRSLEYRKDMTDYDTVLRKRSFVMHSRYDSL